MNEEFALLKSMIPACTGEMHKLAILQVRYSHYRPQYIVSAVHKMLPTNSESYDTQHNLPTNKSSGFD
jgi:hypothetical protein